jgi:hypothetical protein
LALSNRGRGDPFRSAREGSGRRDAGGGISASHRHLREKEMHKVHEVHWSSHVSEIEKKKREKGEKRRRRVT